MNLPLPNPRRIDDFRTLADAIPQIVWAAKADGSVDYMNRAWFEYSGQSERQALADGWHAVMHPDDLERIVAEWQRCIETGESYDVEFRLRRADGAYRWFVGRAEAVRDERAEIVRWYGGCTDVDDLKVAQNALRERATTFRKLANSLPQIVWMTDGNGKNTFLNNRWFDYTGIDPRSPHALERVAHPDDYRAAIDLWRECLASGAVYEIEYRLKRADGVYRWFLGRAVPVRNADERIGEWFGSCTDIEDRKRAENEIRTAYEREHRIATTLQRAFLTHRMPQVDGLRFDAVYRPAEREAEVGGDWYDAIELDDGRIVISIGDVAGHGLDAAVVMGNVRQSIRVVSQAMAMDPVEMLDVADRSLRRESPDTLVTAFIGIIDAARVSIAFATAGHPPPLLYADGIFTELAARGLPLGLRDGHSGRLAHVDLPASGTLLLYTDGLVESTRDLDEGERRVREALATADRDELANPAQYVQERVLREGARDDVAVLAVTIRRRDARSREKVA